MSTPATRVLEILRLGWPTLIAQWAVMLNGVVDTVMAGQLAPADLAAVGLGSAIYVTVNVGLVGVLMALMPEIARHHGAGESARLSLDFRQGLWLALAVCLPGLVLLQADGLWQSFGDPGQAVSSKLHDYLWWITLALPANLLMRCCYCLNMGIGRPKVMMIINLVMLAAKVPLNLLLVFGHGNWSGMGAAGCAAASALIVWLGLAAHLSVLRFGKFYRSLNLFGGPWAPHWQRIADLLKLGVPTAGGYLLEVTSFTFMALWLARLGAQVSASHQIAANFTALIYMIGLALANATTNLTARELGAGRHGEARAYTMTGLKLAGLTALAVGALVALFNHQIAALYTNKPDIIESAASLLLLVAVYHLFDVGQTSCAFILRAHRVVTPTVWIFFLSLWVVGLGAGYSLSFAALPPQWFSASLRHFLQSTPFGFWLGGLLGVASAALALFALLMRTIRQASPQEAMKKCLR